MSKYSTVCVAIGTAVILGSGISTSSGGDLIFQDGLETGTTCAWSSTVPPATEICDGLDNDCNGIPDDGNSCAGVGAPCADDGDCQSGACKPVLGGTGSVCAPSADHCVRQDTSLVYTTDEQSCEDRNGTRACVGGEWVLNECTVTAPLCEAGSCITCLADELRCLSYEQIVQCNGTGTGWDLMGYCDYTFNNVHCYTGLLFCAAGPPYLCDSGAIRGCSGGYAYLQCGASGELPLERVQCGAGEICADPGECLVPPFDFLIEDPPSDVFVRDVTVTEGPSSTTATLTWSGAFALNDLELRVLDLDSLSFDYSGVMGTGRSPRMATSGNLSNFGHLATWYAEIPPATNEEVYIRWFNADGSPAGSEAMVGAGRFAAGVVLGVYKGAVVWDDMTSQVVGRFLDQTGPDIDFTVGSRGSIYAAFPDAAPHADGFIVVWTLDIQSVYTQCFDSSGTAVLGSPLVVASGGGQQTAPIVAGAPGQGAVVVWEDVNAAIRAQRIGTNCQLVGGSIEVTSTHERKAVAMWPDGRFVVAFEETEIDSFGRQREAIFAKTYSASGALQMTYRVTPVGINANDGLGVAAWGTDSFVVVWTNDRDEAMLAKRFN